MGKLTLSQALEHAINAGAAAPGTFKAQVWETGTHRCNILRANYSFRYEQHQIGIHLERDDKSKTWVNIRIPQAAIVTDTDELSDDAKKANSRNERMLNSALVQILGLGFSKEDIRTILTEDNEVIVSGVEALVTRIPGRVVDVDVFRKERNDSRPDDPKFNLFLNGFKLIGGGDTASEVVEEDDEDLFS